MSLTSAQQRDLKRFLKLINPNNPDLAEEQYETLFDELADTDEDNDYDSDESDYDYDDTDSEGLVWSIAEAIDWQSGYQVDWKDTESFVGSLEALCENQDLKLDWGVEDPLAEDFLDQHDVPELMRLAFQKLEAQGYSLWNWQTDSDCYAGWLSRSIDDAKLLQVCADLGIDLRLANEPY